MFVATLVVTSLLAVAMVAGGLAALAGAPAMLATYERLGVGRDLGRAIGALEVAAGAGLLVGLWSRTPAVGLAAAGGIVALMLGAIGYHARAGDYRDPVQRGAAMAPMLVLVLAAAALGLRAVTA